MTRQKSEDPIVPEGRRKSPQTARAWGGKGVPVDKERTQLGLPLATAESRKGPTGGALAQPTPRPGPKANVLPESSPSTTMETVIRGLDEALHHVVRNQGAPGPDGLRVEDVSEDWPSIRRLLIRCLRDGTYSPGPARRKTIPKPGGGERALSIPNVVDRVVQQAMRAALQPLFEPDFSEHSHGFRPKRSCHTAITEARTFVGEGFRVVVDLDLSKFFDRVNHQRLLARVSSKVDSTAFMRLLNRVLRSETVMPDGLLARNEEGVPQGGPLSPLLSNIVLDELDHELEQRGHRFVRYADDIAIFVRSRRSAERVMESITRFIEKRMRLMVNTEKSIIRRPDEGNLLGFRLVEEPDGTVEIDLSDRTMKRAHARIRELTPRTWGDSISRCLIRLNRYFTGWFGFFGICTKMGRARLHELDGRARRRVRAIQLRQWKRKRTILRKLNRMKYSKNTAKAVYSGKRSWWALSGHGVVSHRLNTAWMLERGLESLLERHVERALPKVVPAKYGLSAQLSLWDTSRS